MIRYALICADCEAEFEAWFRSSETYDTQAKAGLVQCPDCESDRVGKQIMAPMVQRKRRAPDGPEAAKARQKSIKAARDYIAKTHDYVGDNFSHEARAMHYGEAQERPIWGEVAPEEGVALHEEGIGVMPLPKSLTPKRPRKKTELN